MDFFYLLLFQLLLILSNAFFACAEIAVLSVNEVKLSRLASAGSKRAKRLTILLKDPARFLATIQVAITLSGFLGSAFAADHFAKPLTEWAAGLGVPFSPRVLEPVAVVFITLILAYFSLVFGELVPKRLTMKRSEEIALGISRLISWISILFKPVVGLLSVSTNAVLRLCGVDPSENGDEVDREDIQTMVDAASEKGTVEGHEKEFIRNLFEFSDISAGDIVTHRTGVVALMLEDSMENWGKIIHESRHSRYPICKDASDNVIGILDAMDYFRLPDKSRKSVMKNAVSPAFFVPESQKASVLFQEMKKQHRSFAVVIDEYGGMAGIVTQTDLLEELVGDLQNVPGNTDAPEKRIEKLRENKWRLTGNIMLDELKNVTGVFLDSGKYETLTGMVFDILGSIPADGKTELTVKLKTASVRVAEIREHRIETAFLVLEPDTNTDAEHAQEE